jgi:hypothetical protein
MTRDEAAELAKDWLRQEQAYRRGYHQGADACLNYVEGGWPVPDLARWINDIAEWRLMREEQRSEPPYPKAATTEHNKE